MTFLILGLISYIKKMIDKTFSQRRFNKNYLNLHKIKHYEIFQIK